MAAVTLEGPVGKKRVYRVRWRYNGQRPRKSLGVVAERDAEARCREIEDTLRLLESGRLHIPSDVDETEFIFSAGRVEQVRKASRRTVQDTIESRQVGKDTHDEYERRLRTVRGAIGGPSRSIDSITVHDLQDSLADHTIGRSLTPVGWDAGAYRIGPTRPLLADAMYSRGKNSLITIFWTVRLPGV